MAVDKWGWGFATGAAAAVAVFVGMKFAIQGVPNICGQYQDGPICTQQWLAALGPMAALIFAGYGAFQLRTQIAQGQIGVAASERGMLGDEFEALATLRDELMDRQRKLEQFDAI